ncbi:hypothetical protein [Dactylosporangium sp. NPDC051541]|uniref:hypothetical protein n=1 Tax=Dactylosporangium sp. NPDC051541 TaxID=3363977 RepID=UPI00378E58DE
MSENDRSLAVAATIDASLSVLAEWKRQRYRELAIFPEDTEIPAAALHLLWNATGGLSATSADALADEFAQLSLAMRYKPDVQSLQLHDVVLQYLRGRHTPDAMAAIHGPDLGRPGR